MNIIITLSISILTLVNTQKAYVFSSSVGYYNYRQNANAMKVYHTLKQRGLKDQDILLAFPENVGCCEKNPLQGTISFYDNDYSNLNKNMEVDLKFSSISVSSVMDSLSGKYPASTLNLNRLTIRDEPYLIYMAGHGGDYYFKIRERQALVSQHFNHLFRDFAVRNPHSPIFLMIDSCSAITPFENVNHQNFMALGSSSLNQKSLSYGFDSVLNQPKSDQFTYYFGQFLKEREGAYDNSASVKDLLNYLDPAKLKVHSKLVSASKRNFKRKLSQFISKKGHIVQKKAVFKLPLSLKGTK